MTRLAELHAGGDPGHTQRPGEGMPPGAFEIGDFLAQASLLWGQFEKNRDRRGRRDLHARAFDRRKIGSS